MKSRLSTSILFNIVLVAVVIAMFIITKTATRLISLIMNV